MDPLTQAFLRALPYFVAWLVTFGEIPSRLLALRHRNSSHPHRLLFARHWSSIGEAIAFPFVSLFYAVTSIVAELESRHQIGLIWWIAGLCVYSTILAFTLLLVTGDLSTEDTLPKLEWNGKRLISFAGLVGITKTLGVLFPGLIDVCLSLKG